jgi:DNA invertase Pin-like site-specific DNA recombinase
MTIKAAQYVRMSTDQQPLSIDTQKAAIKVYADKHHFEIVSTYADEACSGLRLIGRGGMQKLLKDVMDAACDFKAILVLDVSRWGRFQDVDESAYYEYHCRKNGVEVIYVAEMFGTNSTPFDAVMKQLKRTMAAEYSRELGVKSRSGQATAVSLGFATGRLPCIGYRREAVPADGGECRLLGLHERKPRITDRVRWVLGPDHEIDAIRWIFAEYANTKSTIKGIVRTLQTNRLTSHRGEQITQYMVRNLLGCEIVLGIFSWGTRTPDKSVTNILRMSESVRNCKMVPPLVDLETWNRTQTKLQQIADLNRNGLDRQDMLGKLRKALKRNPLLSWSQFVPSGLAHAATYKKHFGSVAEAFRLAQRPPALADMGSAPTIRVHKRFFLRDLYQALMSYGVPVEAKEHENLLIVSGITVKPRSAEARRDRSGSRYWVLRKMFRPDAISETPWLLVLCSDESSVATHFFLLSPEQHAKFDGRIQRGGGAQEERYCFLQPMELMGRLRALACCGAVEGPDFGSA